MRKGREPSEQSGQGWPLGGGDVSGKNPGRAPGGVVRTFSAWSEGVKEHGFALKTVGSLYSVPRNLGCGLWGPGGCLGYYESLQVHGGSLGWGSGCGDADKWRCAVCFGGRTVDVVGGLDWRREEWESHAAVPSGQGGWVSV